MTIDGSVLVVYQTTGAIDAIDQYSRLLVEALRERGVSVGYEGHGPRSAQGAREPPQWVLLQYNPYAYGRFGVAPALLRDTLAMRRKTGARLVVMVHEAWIAMNDPKSYAVGLWQRGQLRALLMLADGVMTSTEALAREVGADAVHAPIGSNITPANVTPERARASFGMDARLIVGLFGREHESRALGHVEAAIAELARSHGADGLAVLNIGADAAPITTPPGVPVIAPGAVSEAEVSKHLLASDVILLPFTDGLSTRRGTLMAALAHGKPVVGLRGSNTDKVLDQAAGALVLVGSGDPGDYARAVCALCADPDRMHAVGARARELYESCFDWPLAAQRVVSLLSELESRSRGQRPNAATAAT
jgi:glycosyltransferase involved in cell wall biosynthesis